MQSKDKQVSNRLLNLILKQTVGKHFSQYSLQLEITSS